MRLVVKAGSSTLSKKNGGLDPRSIGQIAKQLAYAHRCGHDVIVVSSGAIAAGIGRLGLKERPRDLQAKQATAAVGQVALMHEYEKALSKFGIIPAQLLLTREDLLNRKRCENVRHTIFHLLAHRAMPIINENDSVSTEEIQFGDNDALSATVAVKISADKLILLSDVAGYFEQDPKGHLTNRVIPVIKNVTPNMLKRANKGRGSKLSVGGIVSKLLAAKQAGGQGIETWIASGTAPDSLIKILKKNPGAGTMFPARKR